MVDKRKPTHDALLIPSTTKITPQNNPSAITDRAFSLIHQGKATHALAKIKTKIDDPAQITFNGDGIIVDKDFKLLISEYNELQNGIRDTAKLLLEALIITSTEKGGHSNEVYLPLRDYMALRCKRSSKTG